MGFGYTPDQGTLIFANLDHFGDVNEMILEENVGGVLLSVRSFKSLDPNIPRQKPHLLDGDLVQLAEPLCLRHLLLDEQGIQIFQIGEANELRHIRIVSNIAFLVRMVVAPFLGSHAK